jgi:hypothetical protein
MLKKSLMALAVAGVLGSSAGAFADAGTDHATYDTDGVLGSEVYLVPAPLAQYDGTRHWKVEVTPDRLDELDRLATENVYVMVPIDDAIVDPQAVLTQGIDAIVDSQAALTSDADALAGDTSDT